MASLTHPLRSARRARWLLTAALVLPLLLFGGAFTWSAPFALGGVALLALLAATVGRRGEARVHPVVLLSAVAWLAVGLQLLPLPRALVALLAPEVLAAKAKTWALLQIEPTWVSLTYDPGGTRGAMLTAATVVAGATASSLLARRHGSRTVVLAALTALVLMALVHLVHALVGLDAVYGAYRPRYAAPQPIGPLLNPNHFGALCAFGATLALGLAVDAPERPRLGLRLLSGTLALTAALSGSRGALLSLVVAAVTLAALLRSQRGVRRLALAVVPAVALVASGALLLPATRARLLDPSTLKLDLAAQSLGLFVEHPIFGVGRGAFSAAFAPSATDATRYTHAENIGAQWVAELGLGGVALGLAALAVLVDGARRRRNALDAASVAACVAFVAHELVDFASELSGAALLVVTVAGTLRAGSRPAVHPRWALALALAALASLPWQPCPTTTGRAVPRRPTTRDGSSYTTRWSPTCCSSKRRGWRAKEHPRPVAGSTGASDSPPDGPRHTWSRPSGSTCSAGVSRSGSS